jgi:hypothetical protein
MMVDEFYHEIEEESDYYDDLLKEDSIKEVDYQMMVETAEIEKNTIEGAQNRPSKRTSRPKKKSKPKATEDKREVKGEQGPSPDKPASDSAPKKRRRPRRRKPKPKPENKGE